MIDELDLIGAFRAEVSEPDAETTIRAKVTLVRAMEQSAPLPSRGTGTRRRPVWHIVGAVTAALAIALAAPTLFPSRDGTPASAAEFLRDQARTALDQPAVWPLQPGQYLYQERIEWNRQCDHPQDSQTWNCTTPDTGAFTHRIWIGADGSGRECFLGLEDATGPPCGDDSAGMLSPIDLSHLPTDPNELLAQAEAGTLPGLRLDARGQDANTAAAILGLLVQPTASPALRASLYEAAAMIPGTELLVGVQDEIERDGTGIAYTLDGTRLEVIFDPRTSNVLEMKAEQVAADPEEASGTPLGVTTWVVFKKTAVVEAIGDRL
jgi:hypothetical protein